MTEKHAKLSPSAAKRWMNCPGCIRLSAGIDQTTSDYAVEGTAAHFVAEQCLKQRCDSRQLWSILSQMKSRTEEARQFAEHKKWINQEMLEHVQGYLDMIRLDMNAIPSGLRIFNVEQRFDLTWLTSDLWGTCDASLGEYLKILRVYDFKYGAGVCIEVEDNPQLMIYALGAIGEHNSDEYQKVEMTIYQPRCYHPDGPKRSFSISVADLFNWAKKKLLPAALATADPKAPLHAGDWCLFCPATAVCPEIAKSALKLARADFSQDPAAITLPDPDRLSDKEIAKVLQFSDLISTWTKEVAAHAQAILEGGGKINGYKLVARRTNRKWKDEAKAAAYMGPTLGRDIYIPQKLKSPAQIEQMLGQNRDWITHLWEKPDAGVTIAPQSDRRKAVMPPAIADFS